MPSLPSAELSTTGKKIEEKGKKLAQEPHSRILLLSKDASGESFSDATPAESKISRINMIIEEDSYSQ